ncbi:MAG: MFS transporter [Promethearchaeota archaeon]
MHYYNPESKTNKMSDSIKTTPDFNSMIRITFWNGLGFIFFMFLKSYVVIYFFGGSGVTLGIIMALQPFARLISMPLIGYLTDHTSKKRLILIGSMGRTLSYILFWVSLVIHNLFLFGLGNFCQGFIVGFFWPPFYALISEKSYKGNRTQSLATGRGKMIGYGFLMGAFISIPIFALVNIFNPDNISLMYSPLLIFAAINLIAGHRFYTKVDENLTYEKCQISLYDSALDMNKIEERREKVENKKNVNNNEGISPPNEMEIIEKIEDNIQKPDKVFYFGFSILILVILITSITGTMYSPFITAYLIENLLPEFSERIVPVIVMIVYFPAQVISQLMAPTLGKIFDRISAPLSIILIGIFKTLMIWLLIWAFTPIDFAFILIFLYIATESNLYLIQAIMSRVSIKHRGKIFGLNIWVDRLGRVIGPLIGGFLWDSLGYDFPFVISIYIGLCLIPIFILAIRTLTPYMEEKVGIDKMGFMKIKK